MKQQKSVFLYVLFSLVLFFVVGVLPVSASAESIATIKLVTGGVDLLRSGKLPAIKASVGDPLSVGDLVRTKSGGYAEVQYKNGTLLKIAQRSRVDIGDQAGGQARDDSSAKLVRGKVQAIVEPPSPKDSGQSPKARRFEIRTPNAVAGVRGTDFVVTFQRNITGVLVKRGTVYTYNRQLPDRVVNVTQSSLTTITAGSPPLKARPATRSEIDRMLKDITPHPEQKSGDSSSGAAPAAVTIGQTQRPITDAIPGDAPITVSGGVSDLLGGTTPRTLQSLTPVYNPTSVQQPVVITPPPPPPPPVPPVITTTTTSTTTTTTVPPTHTNVNVDVKF